MSTRKIGRKRGPQHERTKNEVDGITDRVANEFASKIDKSMNSVHAVVLSRIFALALLRRIRELEARVRELEEADRMLRELEEGESAGAE